MPVLGCIIVTLKILSIQKILKGNLSRTILRVSFDLHVVPQQRKTAKKRARFLCLSTDSCIRFQEEGAGFLANITAMLSFFYDVHGNGNKGFSVEN